MIFFLSVLLLVNSSQATSVTSATKRMSLDQLFAVQTLLRVKLDGQDVCSREFSGVSQVSVAAMPQMLEAEVVSRVHQMHSEGTLIPYLSEPGRMRDCAKKCRCDLYDLALEKVKGPRLPTRRPLRPEQFLKCAKANENWICQGALLRVLISDAKKATE